VPQSNCPVLLPTADVSYSSVLLYDFQLAMTLVFFSLTVDLPLVSHLEESRNDLRSSDVVVDCTHQRLVGLPIVSHFEDSRRLQSAVISHGNARRFLCPLISHSLCFKAAVDGKFHQPVLIVLDSCMAK